MATPESTGNELGISQQTSNRREMPNLVDTKGLCLLSLDGGGVSGLLIAVMLRMLAMDVDESIDAYTRAMEGIFKKAENSSMTRIALQGGTKRFESRSRLSKLQVSVTRIIRTMSGNVYNSAQSSGSSIQVNGNVTVHGNITITINQQPVVGLGSNSSEQGQNDTEIVIEEGSREQTTSRSDAKKWWRRFQRRWRKSRNTA
ncbi:hypothetical protein BJ508DRAFT_416335 [Ascobolus immersus RN42]|uniref:PNPLA domain-containing protein n=1 Tax=Ascobolus immersus RN42 TaxID=1160509 RepID=A0A3N4HYE6_ASCIM|nr:hypothetical protein BJ508DRAFT_416335 [Ascobolus immersus RN42]